jgi:hypothetical protein
MNINHLDANVQMQVVSEDGEFDDEEAKPLASVGERLFDDPKAPAAA